MLTAPEALASHHIVDPFSCGEAVLDDWLRKRALANQQSGASRTFVVSDDRTVVAYYALASSAVSVTASTGKLRRNMPDSIPVVLLGRLAVTTSHHGRGIGRALFQDAAQRVVHAADAIGIRGMIVHAISENAATFYRRIGFEPSPLDALTRMVTLTDLRAAMK